MLVSVVIWEINYSQKVSLTVSTYQELYKAIAILMWSEMGVNEFDNKVCFDKLKLLFDI